MPASLDTSACQAPSTRTHTGFVARLLATLSVHRQRQALLRMDDAMLRDIGLTRDQAMAEGSRPLWDAPATWRR